MSDSKLILPAETFQKVENPFSPSDSASGAVSIESSRAVAEVQALMLLARNFPRDQMKAMDNIINACTRPALAENAQYAYARGGTDISGPSIRLAETMAQCWGNIMCGVKELSRANGYSEAMAYAMDLETGFRDERTFQVKHWRDTKKGGYALTDERDIYEAIANVGARRKRACILATIPGDVQEAALRQCDVTASAKADTSPEALLKIVSSFKQFDVSKEQIEARLQRKMEAIRPAQVLTLRKIFASIRDGMSEAKDWFEATPIPVATVGRKTFAERAAEEHAAKSDNKTMIETAAAEGAQPPAGEES